MRRLNPKTGEPFKRGDVREDGRVFNYYQKTKLRKDGTFYEFWITPGRLEKRKEIYTKANARQRSTIPLRVQSVCWSIKHRAKKYNIPFNLSPEYLLRILPDVCPVFGLPFVWFSETGKIVSQSPSLDKIIPELGYVEGNVQWMSNKANSMKQDASPEQLKQFAMWVLNQS